MTENLIRREVVGLIDHREWERALRKEANASRELETAAKNWSRR